MEGKGSPFAPASEIPPHKNAPLAPSQELAYRNKCIQLRKRLDEIEVNNDALRKEIMAKKDRVNKQRLLRAILLDKVREIMETPGRKFTPGQLEKLGIVDGDMEDLRCHKKIRLDEDVLLDDSSGDSDEDMPEPTDRPVRIDRRNQQTYRGEGLMNANESFSQPDALRHGSTLPVIAPASSFSPTRARANVIEQPLKNTAGADSPVHSLPQPTPSISEARFAQSSPVGHAASAPQASQITASRSVSLQHGVDLINGTPASQARSLSQPQRPPVPYDQFVAHMRPQLEADSYPEGQIQGRIDEEWHKLSRENRQLWEERYNEQMQEYETAMDVWRRQHRAQGHQGQALAAPRHSGAGSIGFRDASNRV